MEAPIAGPAIHQTLESGDELRMSEIQRTGSTSTEHSARCVMRTTNLYSVVQRSTDTEPVLAVPSSAWDRSHRVVRV